MSKSRRQVYLALLLRTLIWGAAFPIIKPALSYISSLQFLYLRFLVASVISLPFFLYLLLKSQVKTKSLLKVLLVESVQILTLPILYLGLSKTSALESSLIGATGPLFIIFGGIWFLHERETKREYQGLLLSLFGSLLLIFEPLWNGHGFSGSSLTGNLLILTYNLLNTIYALLVKKVYKKSPPIVQSLAIYPISSIVYGIMLFSSHSLPDIQTILIPPVLLSTLYMGILGTVLAFALQLYAASKIEVSEANLFSYLDPLVSIPTAYLLLGETPSLTSILAILVIAYGVYRAERKT